MSIVLAQSEIHRHVGNKDKITLATLTNIMPDTSNNVSANLEDIL